MHIFNFFILDSNKPTERKESNEGKDTQKNAKNDLLERLNKRFNTMKVDDHKSILIMKNSESAGTTPGIPGIPGITSSVLLNEDSLGFSNPKSTKVKVVARFRPINAIEDVKFTLIAKSLLEKITFAQSLRV